MMWIIAILTMVVGAVLAIAQTDVKRMLAYSSVAHTGFLLTGVLGVQSVTDLADGQITSLQAVLFYLVTYGFATIGAFAVVTLVRDAGGEQTHLARWAGPRQGVAARGGRLRVLPAGDGRHPADLRVHRQVGGLRGRALGGRLAGRARRDADQRRRGVLLRPGDRGSCTSTSPTSESAERRHPSVLTAATIGVAAAATLGLGIAAGPGARPGAGRAGEFIR